MSAEERSAFGVRRSALSSGKVSGHTNDSSAESDENGVESVRRAETPNADTPSGHLRRTPNPFPRLLLIHALQLPALGLVLVSPYAAAWWCAGLWGSVVACVGTDSGWRWLNRMLVAEAILWLTGALVFGT